MADTSAKPPADNAAPQAKDAKDAQDKDAKAPPKLEPIIKEKGRGIVKSVLSGDTLVLVQMNKVTKSPPIERTLIVSSIECPKMGRRYKDKKEADEPWAYESREYLRKLIIGKTISYVIEFKTAGGREFATVTYIDEEQKPHNLASLIVENGWAKAQRRNREKAEGEKADPLVELEENAEKKKIGIFSKKKPIVRKTELSDVATYFSGHKEKPLKGVVEGIRSGNVFRIQVEPDYKELLVFLSGVKCPDISPDRSTASPYGREALFFSEFKYLHRDVSVILEGVDKRSFYGTVSFAGQNCAEQLLASGLGSYVEWSAKRSAMNEKLKQAEKSAKSRKIRLFSGDFLPDGNQVIKTPGVFKEINGKVVDVVSPSQIIVEYQNQKAKVNLSSIKTPRMAMFGDKDKENQEKDQKKKETDAFERRMAWEGREHLRRRVIGKKVKCSFDYTRPSVNKKDPERAFYTVYFEKSNLAVELCERGLAEAFTHSGGDERSRDYELILIGEETAKAARRGLFNQDKSVSSMVDLTVDSKQVKEMLKTQYYPSMERSGKVRGHVEMCFSATRYKIFVPKQNAYMVFSLASVRGPQKNDKFSEPAKQFVRNILHLRDVDVETHALDKGGNMIGNMYLTGAGRLNIAAALLEAGFCKTWNVSESEHATEYIIAEDTAKKAKKNVWENYDEAAVQAARQRRKEEEDERRKPKQELIDVTVTEILDGSHFYVQVMGSEVEQLQDLMDELGKDDSGDAITQIPKRGELVKCKFSEDGCWYRAQIKASVDDKYRVFYIDYGNSELVAKDNIRTLADKYKKLPGQAKEACLAYIRTPALEEEYGEEAALFLKDLVWDKKMMANIEMRDRDSGSMHLSLGDRESEVHVNAALLRAGLARMERMRFHRGIQELIGKLRQEEDKARKEHLGIFMYGDPGEDDE